MDGRERPSRALWRIIAAPSAADTNRARGPQWATVVCLTRHNVGLHRSKDREQFALFLLRHLELAQGLLQVLHQCIEVLPAHAHAGMGGLHVTTAVDARSTGPGADLIDQIPLETRDVGVGEEAVDASVRRNI